MLEERAVTEAERLAAVRRYNILDTPPDGAFDRITAIAARLLNVPIAIISIVDEDRIWFKSHHGTALKEVGRDPGLCASCIVQDDPWIVGDARRDVRALANPLVAGKAGIQFYLGIPLRTHEGYKLGTLCVLDTVPRTVSEDDVANLADLTAVVMDELELRLAARRALDSFHAELARRELREDRIKGLLRELAHRSKNLMAVVLATARHTVPEDSGAQEYAAALSGRISALARVHDLIADKEWSGADLHDIAVQQIGEDPRVFVSGPATTVTPAAAQHIAMAMHELAINAQRHGALSAAQGTVSLTWQLDDAGLEEGWLHLVWREQGGAPVPAPKRAGFGRLVLERLTPEGLGGAASLSFARDGVVWSCEIPSDRIIHAANGSG